MGHVAMKARAAVPYSELPYTGQPSDTETVTIGADVYEFCTDEGSVAADGNIGVVIGGSADATAQNLVDAINAKSKTNRHLTLFKTDDETPARANGAEKFRAVLDASNNIIYLYSATKAGGQELTKGTAPNKAVSDTATNVGPWKHLNANLSVSGAPVLMDESACLKHVVAAANLTAAQPLKIPLEFAPLHYIVQVYDSVGRLKVGADVKVSVPAAVSGQNFLGIALNSFVIADIATEGGALQKASATIPIVAAAAKGAYVDFPYQAVRVVKTEQTSKAAPASGGTLALPTTITKTSIAGAETVVASAVETKDALAHVPFNVAWDDAALPQTLAKGDRLYHALTGDAGITAPSEVTVSDFYVVLVEAGDVLHIHVAG